MSRKLRTSVEPENTTVYFWPNITMAMIRCFAHQIAERFQPEKIILFGSFAYGTPHADSDVDVLVVMPAADEMNQAVRILEKTDPPFPIDLIVRTPHNLQWRLEAEDWFLREIVSKGKVLYEKAHQSQDQLAKERR